MGSPGASIQLIVFGERSQTDIAGVLSDVTEAGFDAIEAGNLFAAHGEATVRDLLDRYGVCVSGAHFGYGDYSDAGRLDANVAYCRAMGITNMICSGVADPTSVAGYVESSRVFNTVAARLKPEGIRFHYHNHAWEFDDIGGTNGMTVLDAETDSDLVRFNIDVFWVTVGGASPSDFIAAHADRAGYYHFKDGRMPAGGGVEFLELGTGVVDLVGSMAAALDAGAEWIVAEQDRTELPHATSASISRQYLREKLKV